MRKILGAFALPVVAIVILSFSILVSAEEEIKVPLSAIKLSKYGKLTSEQLDKGTILVPRTWIKEDWLKVNKEVSEKEQNSETITVPFSAIKTSKYGELTSEQFSKKKVTVKKSWVKETWLRDQKYNKQTDKTEDLWKRKWSQQPDPKHTLHRVHNPEDYDVQGLRVNADFKVDLSEWFEDLKPKTYWVPAASLGTPDNTKAEILCLKGKPEKAKKQINVLFEALSFIHLATEPNIHNAKTEGQKGIRWGFPKPAKPAIRDGTVNCASAANIIRYLLEDDYEEVGYVWRHSAFDSNHVGGHCTSYIKHEGKYYFFDPVSLSEERSKYPVEDGDGRGYHVDRADHLIQSSQENYILYLWQLSEKKQAIFATFQCEDNHFALGSKDRKLYYPMAFDPANLTIWNDPQDSVELVQANYSPTPPKDQYGVKNYADYMPFSGYLKPWEWKVEDQGQAEVLEMKSDG